MTTTPKTRPARAQAAILALLCAALLAAMAAVAAPAQALAADLSAADAAASTASSPYTGSCGDAAVWRLDATAERLTITGSGAMSDYTLADLPPWLAYAPHVKYVQVAPTVTHVGDYAFFGCTALRSASFGGPGLKSVGDYAFFGCTSLAEVSLPLSVDSIGKGAFRDCTSLASASVPRLHVEFGDDDAFGGCPATLVVTGYADSRHRSGSVMTVPYYCYKNSILFNPLDGNLGTLTVDLRSAPSASFPDSGHAFPALSATLRALAANGTVIRPTESRVDLDRDGTPDVEAGRAVTGAASTLSLAAANSVRGTRTYSISGTDRNVAAMSNPDGYYYGSVVMKMPKVPISQCSVDPVAQQYETGLALEPAVTVRDGGKVLERGTDYEVSYKDNVTMGQATVTVTGTGDYDGTRATTFQVVRRLSECTVEAIPDQAYTGTARTPAVVVKRGGSTLTPGTDYEASYSNNVSPGTASVTISGKGGYVGARVASFKVLAPPAPPAPPAPKSPVVKAKKKTVTLKYANVKKKARKVSNLKVVTDGKVTYMNVSTSKAAKKWKVGKSTGKVTVPKGTKAKTYKVKVRVQASAGATYAPAVKTVGFKVKVK